MSEFDMSIEGCAKRYHEKRDRILKSINSGGVSASMSGIDYYPAEFFHELDNEVLIKVNLTWDGEKHIERPNWKREFEKYVSKQEGKP